MIDFIPLEDYTYYYYQFIFVICIITYIHTLALKGYEKRVFIYNNYFSIFLLLSIVPYMGLRPISGKYFTDMATYAQTFQQFQNGMQINPNGDVGFELFLKVCSTLMSVELFFLLCACIYIIPLFLAVKKWFPNYYFFAFLLLIESFSFWTYGTNGIRNGMATSLFILALSYLRKNHVKMVSFLIISVMFHKSMLLPIGALITTFFIRDTTKYFMFWALSIVLSLTMGAFWVQLFATMGFGDDRLAGYLTAQADSSQFSSTGFRFDFLIYSAAPLFLAYFYVIKKGFNDIIYNHILHTYIIANAFWIMVIRANFSNRFAYLSWFLMALVVGYPLFKEVFWENQFKKIGVILILYYSFTYFMFYYYEFR
ncbi:EpsG family protein [Algibacter sp. L1A34]|uniref:EpsG family protein n=1 Tax=Algibacter sp. L1A34 TaxID=2686365 RepID=UPI00131AC32F|nr:EpsG family protein [Algibacter sp. L1A34]